MTFTNKLGCVVAAVALYMLLVSCNHVVNSTTPNSGPPTNLPETRRIFKPGKFKLHEIANLPAHGLAGTVRLQFLNKQEGWLYNFNHLWHTSDGGKTWETLFDVSSDITAGYSFVQFINAQVGWRQRIDTLEKTVDGGNTWKRVAAPFKPDVGIIFSINFLPDGRQGWLTGGVFRPLDPSQYGELPIRSTNADGTKALDGVVYYTEDSGRTWRQQTIKTVLGEIVREITITSTGKAWTFAGYDSFYLEGNQWKKVDYRSCSDNNQMLLQTVADGNEQGDIYKPQDIFFIDDSQGWSSFANGYIAKTTDGGKTWCDLSNLKTISSGTVEQVYLSKMHFINTMDGLALSVNGVLYETNDGGASWSRIEPDFKIDDIYFDGGNIWAASKEKLFSIALK